MEPFRGAQNRTVTIMKTSTGLLWKQTNLRHVLEDWLTHTHKEKKLWHVPELLRELQWISTGLQPLNSLCVLNYMVLQEQEWVTSHTTYCTLPYPAAPWPTHCRPHLIIRHFPLSVKKMCSLRARKVPVWYFSSDRKSNGSFFFLKNKTTKTKSLLFFF